MNLAGLTACNCQEQEIKQSKSCVCGSREMVKGGQGKDGLEQGRMSVGHFHPVPLKSSESRLFGQIHSRVTALICS